MKGKRVMLDKLTHCAARRSFVTDFWEWLEGEYTPEAALRDIDLDRALDKYHGIDRRQLEEERRALLDEQRAANQEAAR